GSYREGVLRFADTDPQMLVRITVLLRRFGFDFVVEMSKRPDGLAYVRVRGGLSEHLRFFHTVDPAVTRKRSIEGMAVKSESTRRVVSVDSLGMEVPLYDMTTGTGDYVSNGVVSHNCFARPTHEYLGLGIGEDFERRIVVKVNAVERLRAELRSPKWSGEHIAMGTNTDPYQSAEGKYHLTQGIVATLAEARNPFSILTKSTLILRDLDLLADAARRTSVHCNLSIGTLDREVWRLTEPGTPPPDRRLEAVRKLNEAGIPCGVLVAPVLPGLSDDDRQVRQVVAACAEAGAVSVTAVALHLRPGVKEHYMAWLASERPDLVPLHERRFGRRSYQEKKEQERLSALVSETLRARPPNRPTLRPERVGHLVGRPTPEDVARHPSKAARPEPSGEQLRLL
ncbi:MAG TPA: radical SAM protein, partial [Acidimicrobiales bacterium]|nr:radical SAM protein [Acidimicrobiales bacterium]